MAKGCGLCAGCLAPKFCGVCRQCANMPRFGGTGTLKEKCGKRKCLGAPVVALLQAPGQEQEVATLQAPTEEQEAPMEEGGEGPRVEVQGRGVEVQGKEVVGGGNLVPSFGLPIFAVFSPQIS